MANRFTLNLTDQEELDLRQMLMMPGFPCLLKFLQIISLEAQSEAMECRAKTKEARLLALTDAQSVTDAVKQLSARLVGYRTLPGLEPTDEEQEFVSNIWDTKESN